MSRARILVVDDEGDILAAVSAFLQGALDVDVVTAGSGAAGLAELQKGTVDLVLSDFRMPVMDGLAFLRRAGELHPEVPRILMTAYPDMQLAIAALNEASIAQFLTKPVDPERLAKVVGEILSSSRRHRMGDKALDRSAALGAERTKARKPGA